MTSVVRIFGQIAGNTDKIFQFGSYSGNNSNWDRLEFKKTRESDGDTWYSATLQLARVVDATTMGYIKFGHYSNDLITFGEGDTERMRLDGSGYLGIGKSNPETNFHSASSNVTVGIFERSSAGNVSVEYRNTDGSMWAGLTPAATGWGVKNSNNLSDPHLFVSMAPAILVLIQIHPKPNWKWHKLANRVFLVST